jgi:hypothetical protein
MAKAAPNSIFASGRSRIGSDIAPDRAKFLFDSCCLQVFAKFLHYIAVGQFYATGEALVANTD